MRIKLNENQSCSLNFTTTKGHLSSLYVACNSLGGWLQVRRIEDIETTYVGSKSAALALANGIVKKSKELNLPCNVEITTTTPQP